MHLVVLTSDGPEHRYVTNMLTRRFEVVTVLVDDRPPPTPLAVVRSEWRRANARQFPSRVLRSTVLRAIGDERRRAADIQRLLGDSSEHFEQPHLIRRVAGINSREALDAASAAQPDVVAVYGTNLVRAPMLAAASGLTLNLHTGISPAYRGADCELWPIYHGDWDMLGSTVHECVAEVDGGEIFATAAAAPRPGDSIHDIFTRCVQVGAASYVDVLERYSAGTLQGERPNLSAGRQFRMAERGAWAEWSVRARLRAATRNGQPDARTGMPSMKRTERTRR